MPAASVFVAQAGEAGGGRRSSKEEAKVARILEAREARSAWESRALKDLVFAMAKRWSMGRDNAWGMSKRRRWQA